MRHLPARGRHRPAAVPSVKLLAAEAAKPRPRPVLEAMSEWPDLDKVTVNLYAGRSLITSRDCDRLSAWLGQLSSPIAAQSGCWTRSAAGGCTGTRSEPHSEHRFPAPSFKGRMSQTSAWSLGPSFRGPFQHFSLSWRYSLRTHRRQKSNWPHRYLRVTI